jgi:TonB-linked SusC/RagA family outer membrane protein
MKKLRPKNLKTLLMLMVMSLFSGIIYAQTSPITGTVVDEKGETLIGATVKFKTGTGSTTTDINGRFSLNLNGATNTLVVSYIGYTTKEVAVTSGSTNITITLAGSSNSLNEVVVVGYGTQRRRDVTGSVVSVKGETLREVPSANLQQALQGRASGLEIQRTSSRPGAGAQIRIRGERSIAGSNEPLLVLDGIPFEGGNLNDINPDEVASVEILKDASATAIYGSRGANGVLLVTTRRGTAGPARISYNAYYGANSVARKYTVYNADEYRAFRDISAWPSGYLPAEVEGIAAGRNTNWQDLLYKNGYITDHNVNISGGNNDSRFSVGGGYFKETTVLPGQDFGRYSLRTTGDFNVGKRFKFGFSSLNTLGITNGSQFGLNMFPLLALSPLTSPYNPDGSINVRPSGNLDDLATTYNPLLLRDGEQNWVDRVRRLRTFNTLFGEVEIVTGLKYRVNVGADYRQQQSAQFQPQDLPTKPSYFRPAQGNTAFVDNAEGYGYTLENLLTYEKTIAKKHRISATGLYSFQKDRSYNSSARKDSVNADFVQYYNLGLANPTPVAVLNGGETTFSLISYMLRLNYAFDDKYLLTVTGRIDGSSRLAEGNKFHKYPAVSAGWVASNESLIKDIKEISLLKFRAGYGETSNQSINPYATLGGVSATLSQGTNQVPIRYNYGPTIVKGYAIVSVPDPRLGWEYTRTTNLGLDFGILDNRFSGSVDWYSARTYDILYGLTLPSSSGISGQFQTNIGEMTNKGMEFSLSTQNFRAANRNGFSWSTDFNAYFNRNKLVKLSDGFVRNVASRLHVGYPLTAIYDYNKIGIWQLDEAAQAAQYGERPGQLHLEDVNGDGKLDPTLDRKVIGSGQADIQGGITNRFGYKGFDLSAVVYARLGGTLISQAYQPLGGYLTENNGRRNQLKVDYWTPTNPTNNFPMPSATISSQQNAYTTLGYYDASFVKMQSINLGYTFSGALAKRISAQSLRVYVNAQNPFYFYSPYIEIGGVDPEANGTGNQGVSDPGNLGGRNPLTIGAGTPPTRAFIFGLNVTF